MDTKTLLLNGSIVNANSLQDLLNNKALVPFSNKYTCNLVDWLSESEEARDYAWLEDTHDYIQYLFPTDQQSLYNANAPHLPWKNAHMADGSVSAVVRSWSDNRSLRLNLGMATMRMLAFFGFGDPVNVFLSLVRQWKFDNLINDLHVIHFFDASYRFVGNDQFYNLVKHAHNDLRITRIIRSWRLFGFPCVAISLAVILKQVLVKAKQVRNPLASVVTVKHIDAEYASCIPAILDMPVETSKKTMASIADIVDEYCKSFL